MSEVIIPTTKPSGNGSQPSAALAVLSQPRPGLAKALAKAVLACAPVEKAAENSYHKYKYASSEAIIDEGRKALASAGLVLLPVEASLVGSERDGPDRFELVRTLLLLHESGESLPLRVVWPVVPDKGRPLDKATAAADTLSLAYLLRDLLLMPRVDEADEVAARDDRQAQAPAKKEPAKQQKITDHMNYVARLDGYLRKLDVADDGELAALVAKKLGCDPRALHAADPDAATKAAAESGRALFARECSARMEKCGVPALADALALAKLPAGLAFGTMEWRHLENLLAVLRETPAAVVPAGA
jgi:hypothetical protein